MVTIYCMQAHQLLYHFILGVRVHGVLAAGVPIVLFRSIHRERRLVPACRWWWKKGTQVRFTGSGMMRSGGEMQNESVSHTLTLHVALKCFLGH